MIARILTLPLVLATLVLTACGSGTTDSAQASTEAPDPENVVARVNGDPISAVALDAQVQAQSSRGQPVDRSRALDELVELTLLAQQAEEQGLPQQPEIAAELERQRAAMLAQHLVRAELADLEVTDEDLRDAYDERVAAAEGREYRASHVLLESEADAQSVIAELDEGADFATLAEEHSTGPTAERGGDLGWFQGDQMVEPFANAVRNMEPGDYTAEPVQTQFGWHVIRLAETRDAQAPAFEDIRSDLQNELVRQHVQDYIASLREQADVEVEQDVVGQAGGDELPAAAEEASGTDSGTETSSQ